MMEQLMIAYDMLQEVTGKTNLMSMTAFGAFFCMVAEEYCKSNNEDIIKFINNIKMLIEDINEELGAY